MELAHGQDISLHAWVNAVPPWRGGTPPTNEEQLYIAHPEWHWFDKAGERQPLAKTFYVSLNPCLPEVQEYLVEALVEIVEEYDVDGPHLDYIRFVDDLIKNRQDYPRDARTLEMYREDTGLAPDDDLDEWKRWKAGKVTDLVSLLSEAMKVRGALGNSADLCVFAYSYLFGEGGTDADRGARAARREFLSGYLSDRGQEPEL